MVLLLVLMDNEMLILYYIVVHYYGCNHINIVLQSLLVIEIIIEINTHGVVLPAVTASYGSIVVLYIYNINIGLT